MNGSGGAQVAAATTELLEGPRPLINHDDDLERQRAPNEHRATAEHDEINIGMELEWVSVAQFSQAG